MGLNEELLENVKEYLSKAKEAQKDKAFNVAVTLYFKAIAVLVDLFLLSKEGFIPSNHIERFRLLESKYPNIYRILDKDFPIYQSSYRVKLNNEYVGVLENDFKEIARLASIKFD